MAVTTYPVLDALRSAYTMTTNPARRGEYGDYIGMWNLLITPVNDTLEATLNLTDGQLLIGSTSLGRPVKAVLTGSGGITITNNSGGIDIGYSGGGSSSTTIQRTALGDVYAGQIVYECPSGIDTCDIADNTNLACLNTILGIATVDTLAGGIVSIQQLGDYPNNLGYPKTTKLYLGTGGNLTNTPPMLGSGYIFQQLAVASNTNLSIGFANGTAFLA